jgi:hypothetical protein
VSGADEDGVDGVASGAGEALPARPREGSIFAL